MTALLAFQDVVGDEIITIYKPQAWRGLDAKYHALKIHSSTFNIINEEIELFPRIEFR